jgi:hypothetical protein
MANVTSAADVTDFNSTALSDEAKVMLMKLFSPTPAS